MFKFFSYIFEYENLLCFSLICTLFCISYFLLLYLQSHFEYEIDSDDEWVDEEPGESLGGSEDDLESEDDYEVDNDMFVPHGYLSDEEGQPDEVPEEISDVSDLKFLYSRD